MTVQELIDIVFANRVAAQLTNAATAYHADVIRSSLQDAKPRGIQAVIWHDRLSRHSIPRAPGLVTIASFRSSYSVIERMAGSLDRVALQIDILPLIVPLHPASLEGMTRETPLIRRLERNGSLLYSRGQE